MISSVPSPFCTLNLKMSFNTLPANVPSTCASMSRFSKHRKRICTKLSLWCSLSSKLVKLLSLRNAGYSTELVIELASNDTFLPRLPPTLLFISFQSFSVPSIWSTVVARSISVFDDPPCWSSSAYHKPARSNCGFKVPPGKLNEIQRGIHFPPHQMKNPSV